MGRDVIKVKKSLLVGFIIFLAGMFAGFGLAQPSWADMTGAGMMADAEAACNQGESDCWVGMGSMMNGWWGMSFGAGILGVVLYILVLVLLLVAIRYLWLKGNQPKIKGGDEPHEEK